MDKVCKEEKKLLYTMQTIYIACSTISIMLKHVTRPAKATYIDKQLLCIHMGRKNQSCIHCKITECQIDSTSARLHIYTSIPVH